MAYFDGPDLREQDHEALASQLARVKQVLFDYRWHTLEELKDVAGGTVASVSARVRDLRKKRFGAYVVLRRRHPSSPTGRTFQYRLGVMKGGSKS